MSHKLEGGIKQRPLPGIFSLGLTAAVGLEMHREPPGAHHFTSFLLETPDLCGLPTAQAAPAAPEPGQPVTEVTVLAAPWTESLQVPTDAISTDELSVNSAALFPTSGAAKALSILPATEWFGQKQHESKANKRRSEADLFLFPPESCRYFYRPTSTFYLHASQMPTQKRGTGITSSLFPVPFWAREQQLFYSPLQHSLTVWGKSDPCHLR